MKNFLLLLAVLFSFSSAFAQPVSSRQREMVLSSQEKPNFDGWQKQFSGTSEDLNDIDILNQTTAVVVGNNGTILKTTDNGLNWVAKNSGGSFDFNAVSFCNDQNGIAVGNTTFNLTTDGGESWLVANFDKNALTLSYRDWGGNSNVIVGCDDGTIRYSSDGGISWQSDTAFTNEPVVVTDFNSSWQWYQAFIATTSFTAFSIVPPFSNSWSLYYNPIMIWDNLTGGNLEHSEQYLIGSGGNPVPIPLLLRKSWSDTLWESIYSFVPSLYVPEDIAVWNEILFVCGNSGRIFKSTDSGNNWSEQFTSVDDDLSAISFWSDSIGYSVGKNGTILFTSNGGVSSVEEIQPPLGHYLFQNYPNPFNPSTKIKFTVADFGFIILKVYDILGNEVETLVEEFKPAGTYEVQFNAETGIGHQASGVYFYQLRTEKFIQTKKMVFLQ